MPRKTTKAKSKTRPPRIVPVFSWEGFEEERDKIRGYAHRLVELYSILHQKYLPMTISGMTVTAYKDPNAQVADP